VAAVEHYPNCRSCDCGYASGLRFFKSLREVLEWAKENRRDYALSEVYGVKTGRVRFEVGYELGRHCCTGVTFKAKGLSIRTIDNGKGDLIWAAE
jgi:hypothetical protein